jgi:structural maintenance of chromosome 1
MIYMDENEEEIVFRRTIHAASGADYSVNGDKVSWKEYVQELEKINVLVKVRNFLVFQGDVESIAQKNPQQLSELVTFS